MTGKANPPGEAKLARHLFRSMIFSRCRYLFHPTKTLSTLQRGPCCNLRGHRQGHLFLTSLCRSCSSVYFRIATRRKSSHTWQILIHMFLKFRISLVTQLFGSLAFIVLSFRDLGCYSRQHADSDTSYYTYWRSEPAVLPFQTILTSSVMSDIKSSLNRCTLQLVRFHAFTNMRFMNYVPVMPLFPLS